MVSVERGHAAARGVSGGTLGEANLAVENGTSGATFEEDMQRLESLVARLEQGNLPLEESLAAFESGVALLRTLHAKLEDVEARVEILVRDADGVLRVRDGEGLLRGRPGDATKPPRDGETAPRGDGVLVGGRERDLGRPIDPEPSRRVASGGDQAR